MSVDPSIIAAIAAAVESSPDSTPLRLHLATLLLDADRPQEALDQCAIILIREPDNREALRKAADAAFKSGDTIRAVSYGRLLDALGSSLVGENTPSLSSPPTPRPSERMTNEGRVPISSGDDDEQPLHWETEKPDITLADVAGMEAVKRRLNIAFLAPMQNPDLRKLYGKSLRGGLLLYGPARLRQNVYRSRDRR